MQAVVRKRPGMEFIKSPESMSAPPNRAPLDACGIAVALCFSALAAGISNAGAALDRDSPVVLADLPCMFTVMAAWQLQAIWLAFGRARFVVRLCVTALGSATLYAYYITNRFDLWHTLLVTVVPWLGALCGGVLRILGLRIRRSDPERSVNASSSPVQFELRHIFNAMAVLAGVGFFMRLESGLVDGYERDQVIVLAVYCSVVACLMPLYLLRERIRWWQLALTIAIVVAIPYVCSREFIDTLFGQLLHVAVMSLPLTFSVLLIYRKLGYRLVRVSRLPS